jgi:hypothetical protein
MTENVLLIVLCAFMVQTGTTLSIRAGLCSGEPGSSVNIVSVLRPGRVISSV